MNIPGSLRFLARIPAQILAGLGLVVLSGTLVLAALISDKNPAVALAIVGTFVGTCLLTVFLPKAAGATRAHQINREHAVSESERRLRVSESERGELQRQLADAEREIARLEAMRINVEAFRPILQLGLLEVETNITDFQHRVLPQPTPKRWWHASKRDAYLGVVQIPVKAQLGVDLKQIRISEHGNQLVLTGVSMSTITDTAAGAKWLLDEVRTEYVQEDQVLRFKGQGGDARAKTYSRDHELQVRARLKAGQDFKVFEAGLLRTAQQLLRVLLAPLGKELLFDTAPRADGRPLLEFLTNHNQQVTDSVAALKQLK